MPRRTQVQVASLDGTTGEPNEQRPQRPPVWMLVALVAVALVVPRQALFAVLFGVAVVLIWTGRNLPQLVTGLRDRLYGILTTLAETLSWRSK